MSASAAHHRTNCCRVWHGQEAGGNAPCKDAEPAAIDDGVRTVALKQGTRARQVRCVRIWHVRPKGLEVPLQGKGLKSPFQLLVTRVAYTLLRADNQESAPVCIHHRDTRRHLHGPTARFILLCAPASTLTPRHRNVSEMHAPTHSCHVLVTFPQRPCGWEVCL